MNATRGPRIRQLLWGFPIRTMMSIYQHSTYDFEVKNDKYLN